LKLGYVIAAAFFCCLLLGSSSVDSHMFQTVSASSPVPASLNIDLDLILGVIQSITPVKTNDSIGPNYVLFYSFHSPGTNFTYSGNFTMGSGCSGDCNATAFPFPPKDTAVMSFRLMDNQSSPKQGLYPVDINGKSDNFSLTLYGTSTSNWCIKSLKTCSNDYSLNGTATSKVPRSAQVDMSVSESNIFPGQVLNRLETYENYSAMISELIAPTCASPWSYQEVLDALLVYYLGTSLYVFDELPAVVLELTETSIEASMHDGIGLVNAWLVSVGQYGAGTPAYEIGGGSSLPLLCENVMYTMIYADGGKTPQISYDLQNMASLISTEKTLVNSNIKSNNATLISNLSSQNSTVAQSITDLSSLNSSLTFLVQNPSACQVYTGYGDSSCAPYAEYIITAFVSPLGHYLASDQTYANSTLALFKNSK
jgi:hypothetical protein